MKYRSSDLLLFWGQMLGHIDSLSKSMTFIHQIVFKLQGKINRLWNIGNMFRSKFASNGLNIQTFDVHPSNSQDIRQDHWTRKYRSMWPSLTLRSKVVSHWLIIQKFDVHPSKSLQDIRQSHWTIKNSSRWPSHHDIQVNIIRSTDA